METIARRLPSEEALRRRAPAILGFCAGVIVPLAIAALFTVIYTGHGILVDPPKPVPVFTIQ